MKNMKQRLLNKNKIKYKRIFMSIYDYKFNDSNSEEVSMADYKGKVLLIVNTASKCGLTGQYEGLENIYKELKEEGLEILGFPCNQFGAQEPGSNSEIQEFCKLQFDIKFPVFDKIDVNGETAHPLYTYLKAQAPGLLGSKSIKWNFTKFLIDRDGNVIKRFAPTDKPEKIQKEVKKLVLS
jgi:glutathione peroxidase